MPRIAGGQEETDVGDVLWAWHICQDFLAGFSGGTHSHGSHRLLSEQAVERVPAEFSYQGAFPVVFQAQLSPDPAAEIVRSSSQLLY